ncbi:MAG: LysM peptidoglycan-binding domain-containing protein [Bacilli bacterium]|nr:LysM peptidoglycan-binding domain-containing protein [Bacilli bacterium]MDD4608185.1 LysM peptidoglycan-binding domain-containing protein [Bacilli bacterium]
MNKIVPFKKNIIFKSNLSEITSISLEHNLHLEQEKIIGEFIISGEYKMVETSTNTEVFSFNLPFEEMLDDYRLDKAKIDIDDFYYEIINSNILRVNVDVLVDGLVEKEEEPIIEEEPTVEEELVVKEERHKLCDTEDEDCDYEPVDVKSLFDTLDGSEVYSTYKVCIVREEDTLESIIERYDTSREELELYNDLNSIKLGDKIIIPSAQN